MPTWTAYLPFHRQLTESEPVDHDRKPHTVSSSFNDSLPLQESPKLYGKARSWSGRSLRRSIARLLNDRNFKNVSAKEELRLPYVKSSTKARDDISISYPASTDDNTQKGRSDSSLRPPSILGVERAPTARAKPPRRPQTSDGVVRRQSSYTSAVSQPIQDSVFGGHTPSTPHKASCTDNSPHHLLPAFEDKVPEVPPIPPIYRVENERRRTSTFTGHEVQFPSNQANDQTLDDMDASIETLTPKQRPALKNRSDSGYAAAAVTPLRKASDQGLPHGYHVDRPQETPRPASKDSYWTAVMGSHDSVFGPLQPTKDSLEADSLASDLKYRKHGSSLSSPRSPTQLQSPPREITANMYRHDSPETPRPRLSIIKDGPTLSLSRGHSAEAVKKLSKPTAATAGEATATLQVHAANATGTVASISAKTTDKAGPSETEGRRAQSQSQSESVDAKRSTSVAKQVTKPKATAPGRRHAVHKRPSLELLSLSSSHATTSVSSREEDSSQTVASSAQKSSESGSSGRSSINSAPRVSFAPSVRKIDKPAPKGIFPSSIPPIGTKVMSTSDASEDLVGALAREREIERKGNIVGGRGGAGRSGQKRTKRPSTAPASTEAGKRLSQWTLLTQEPKDEDEEVMMQHEEEDARARNWATRQDGMHRSRRKAEEKESMHDQACSHAEPSPEPTPEYAFYPRTLILFRPDVDLGDEGGDLPSPIKEEVPQEEEKEARENRLKRWRRKNQLETVTSTCEAIPSPKVQEDTLVSCTPSQEPQDSRKVLWHGPAPDHRSIARRTVSFIKKVYSPPPISKPSPTLSRIVSHEDAARTCSILRPTIPSYYPNKTKMDLDFE